MNRNKFLKELGFKGAALVALYCSGACTYDHSSINPNYPVDFTIDLNDPEYNALKSEESFLITQSIVVVHTTGSTFVAASIVCSHEGLPEITFDSARNIFSCNAHGAEYSLSGKSLNERGKNGIKIYQTSLSETNLRIYA